jgi:hypothetical protein
MLGRRKVGVVNMLLHLPLLVRAQWMPTFDRRIRAYCALSGVRSGVKQHRPLPIPTGLIAPREDLARTIYGPRKVSPPSLSMRRSSE